MAIHRVSGATSIPALVLAAILSLVCAGPVAAVNLLRDADIEHGLAQLAFPILRAAGLSTTRMRILVIDDSSLNAFVIDNQTIYLHSGLILKVQNARMLQAVIAHEAAHIANGHIARRMANLRSARTAAGVGMALAVLAAAAGGGGEAASVIGIGTASSAQRSFLRHSRAEEAAADRSAASFLRSSEISPMGLVEVHEIFRGQELLTVGRQDPYMRSHPLTSDRIRAAKAYVDAYGDNSAPNAVTEYWFARVRGKLSAFTRSSKWTMRRITAEQFADVKAMREAIAYHLLNDRGRAVSAIDRAMALRPDDPYYYDLKGQILMENRRMHAAAAVYETAVSLAPREPLILGGYGRALLATGQPKKALEAMEKARDRDFRDIRVLRDMSIAYAQTGQNGNAALATAERYALQGQIEDAARQARRAVALLPTGSPSWHRAQDVLGATEKLTKGKKR